MTETIDGGYFAIKGFLYQFDRTLIEMLNNPTACVAFENRQDIDYDDWVIQIKHKETQDFRPAKIRRAVGQLLALFAGTPGLKLILYCYFKDQTPRDWTPSLRELDEILAEDAGNYPVGKRRAFLRNLSIRFSSDFEVQFRELISLIKNEFSIVADEEAIIYHSLLRSHLLTRSILPKGQRRASLKELKVLSQNAEKAVFYTAYSRYLGTDKYEKMLKKHFFTFRAANIENFERLIILDPEPMVPRETLLQLATTLSQKYFRRGKSPQPYLCVRNLPADVISEMKRSLVDQNIAFFDGTHFDGDRFRLDELVLGRLSDPHLCLKIVPESALPDILSRVDFNEVFQFYVRSPADIASRGRHVCMALTDCAQAVRIIR